MLLIKRVDVGEQVRVNCRLPLNYAVVSTLLDAIEIEC